MRPPPAVREDPRDRVLHVGTKTPALTETFILSRLPGRRYAPWFLAWSVPEGGHQVACPTVLVNDPDAQRAGESPPDRARASWAWSKRRLRNLRALREVDPVVAHAHFGPAGVRIDRECRVLGIPLVVSFYGHDATRLPMQQPHVASAYRRMFRSAAALTAEGPVLAKRLVEIGAPADRVRLLPLSLPRWALDAPDRSFASRRGQIVLLQVARFVEKKGVERSVRAVALARERGVDARLVLVGGGRLESSLRQLAGELGVGEAVELPGYVPHSALPRMFGEVDAYLQPSETAPDGDTEGGAPTVILEAQAQGLPVIATHHADIPNVVRDGETALLRPERDVEGLAGAIVELANHPAARTRLGVAGRRFVLRRHDPDRLCALRERIYRESIRRARPRLGGTHV